MSADQQGGLAASLAAHLETMSSGRHVLSGFEMRDVEVGEGRVVVEVDVDDSVAGPAGALHGGLLATVADHVGGRLASAHTAEDELVVTTDLTIHYLAPIKTTAHVVGEVLKRGRRTVVVRVDVSDREHGPRAASCTLQFAVIRPALP